MDSDRSKGMASMLRSATNRTTALHGNDVKTAYSLLTHLLQYESTQQGFNMTATRDVQFHEVGCLNNWFNVWLSLWHYLVLPVYYLQAETLEKERLNQ